MIEREERDGIATVRLAHGKASALDVEFIDALVGELDTLARSDARAVIVTGTGSIFSAGVDLFRIVGEGPAYVERFLPALNRVVHTLFTFPKPVVAAANGHAIAGGCVIVEACDYRLMARGKGRMGVPELLVGVPFPALVVEVLRFALPADHLQEIVYTGGTWQADDAHARGLIDEAADPESLLDRAHAVAAQLAALPPEAFHLVKRQMRQPALDLAARFAVENDPAAFAIWSAPETHATIRAYLERTVGQK